MDLKKDEQKIYSIEAEYYGEHMKANSQVSVSHRLNSIIKVLMVVLLLIVSFFIYKIVESNASASKTPVPTTKNYVEVLAANKSVDKEIKHLEDKKVKKIVMGVSVVASSVEKKLEENKTALNRKKIESKKPIKMELVIREEETPSVVLPEKKVEQVEHIENEEKSISTDILSLEYLKKMENALKSIE